MTKQEFLTALRERLDGISDSDAERWVSFYSEMIDDRMEDGMSEAEAVANVGDVDDAARQIRSQWEFSENQDRSPETTERKTEQHSSEYFKGRYKLRNPWAVGFLFPFLLILWAVAFSLLTAFWSVLVFFYVVCGFLSVSGCIAQVMGIALIFLRSPACGLVVIGAGMFAVGFSILFGMGCKFFRKGMVKLTKWTVKGLVWMIVRKEQR
ncbi:MAG: DUF1700 domain-containing protein [Clostridia bacterium]|nr:DUF1700 domain-containing protein [Clostridia bacterium]